MSVQSEDHLDPRWKSNTSVGSSVLGGLFCHHSEIELAQRANKSHPHLSPQAQPDLVRVMGFSVVLFVCLFGLKLTDTQHGAERRSGGTDDTEQKREEAAVDGGCEGT